ncbi:hypothetical protein BTVI_35949 [Pitangus sulphuratus]|nr:hypothetical protein BTVI_35949 [Pitangus sulphuratus]
MNGTDMEEIPFQKVKTKRKKCCHCCCSPPAAAASGAGAGLGDPPPLLLLDAIACEDEFDCKELEALFQSYNLKLEQTSTLKALAVLIVLTASLALVELLSGPSLTISKGSHPVHCIIFLSLFIVTNVKYLQVTQLQQIVKLTLLFSFTFSFLCCPFSLGAYGMEPPSAPEQGMWQLMLVTFVSYSLLPVRTLLAIVFGLVVSVSHLIVTATSVSAKRQRLWRTRSSSINSYKILAVGKGRKGCKWKRLVQILGLNFVWLAMMDESQTPSMSVRVEKVPLTLNQCQGRTKGFDLSANDSSASWHKTLLFAIFYNRPTLGQFMCLLTSEFLEFMSPMNPYDAVIVTAVNEEDGSENILGRVIIDMASKLVANAILFVSVNLYGVFVRILTERAQRKAFLQARNCIEDRLRLEDENEKQGIKMDVQCNTGMTETERLLMSLLPRNVAMEMKEDFLKPPERIFHKIYIQRHDNVRSAAVTKQVLAMPAYRDHGGSKQEYRSWGNDSELVNTKILQIVKEYEIMMYAYAEPSWLFVTEERNGCL